MTRIFLVGAIAPSRVEFANAARVHTSLGISAGPIYYTSLTRVMASICIIPMDDVEWLTSIRSRRSKSAAAAARAMPDGSS